MLLWPMFYGMEGMVGASRVRGTATDGIGKVNCSFFVLRVCRCCGLLFR
jgi:hypothetical protein